MNRDSQLRPVAVAQTSNQIEMITAHSGEKILYEVLDHTTYKPVLQHDLADARALVLLQSPFLTVGGVERWSPSIKECMQRGVRVCVFAQEPPQWQNRSDSHLPAVTLAKLQQIEAAIELLKSLGVHVNLRKRIHEKLVVIDEKILWEGSLNILSHYDTSERLTRWISRTKVDEALSRHGLATCDSCSAFPGFALFSGFGPGATISGRLKLMGQTIANARKTLGLSQIELASKVGAHHGTISEIEAGKRNVKLSTLIKVCRAVGLELVLVPRYLIPAIESLIATARQQNGHGS